MKENCLLCLWFLFALSAIGKAQESADCYDNMANVVGTTALYLMLNQVDLSPPDGFYRMWLDPAKDKMLEGLRSKDYKFVVEMTGVGLQCGDERFMTVIDIAGWYSKDGKYCYSPGYEWHIDRLGPDAFLIDRMQRHSIYWDFYINTGNDNPDRSVVRILSSDYARRAFNADTVLTFPLKVWRPYKKYRHCRVTVIQKNGRGHIQLYTFYTDEGEKELDNYLRSLEKMIWYRDPEDFIDFRYKEPEVIPVIINKKLQRKIKIVG